jgi:hypothetical protein
MQRKWPFYFLLGIAGITAASLAGKRYAESVMRQDVDAAFAAVERYAEVRYGDVRIGLVPPALHIRDVSVTPVASDLTFRVADIALRDVDRSQAVPQSMDVTLAGITGDVGRLAELDPTGVLEAVSGEPIEGRVDLRYRSAASPTPGCSETAMRSPTTRGRSTRPPRTVSPISIGE